MRQYHVVVRNDRTGRDIYMTRSPETHDTACTILKKLMPISRSRPNLRHMLVEANKLTNGYALVGEGPSRVRQSRHRRKKHA